jgi:anti-anti-sigma regulatory factor
VHVSAINGTLLLQAAGALGASEADRLREHIDRARQCDRSVVLDLTDVEHVEREALDMLREQWRTVGDRLRVVAPGGSAALAAIKRGGLRRFAVHGTLSGALVRAAE